MKAVVTDRGRVTIPKELRDRLGIAPKAVLDFQEENGTLVARKVAHEDPVTEVMGCLKSDRPTSQVIAELRGET